MRAAVKELLSLSQSRIAFGSLQNPFFLGHVCKEMGLRSFSKPGQGALEDFCKDKPKKKAIPVTP